MESRSGGLNYEYDFQDIFEGVKNLECACAMYREIIIFIKLNMMGSVDNIFSIWIPVENNYYSSCISHETTSM